MSGRARLTVCAAAASIMAACSLLPLATPTGWILQAAFLVALQSTVGALARRVPLPRPLTVLAQALVTLLILTLMFVSKKAVGGVLPGPKAFAGLGRLLSDGLRDVSQFAIPAPVTPGIRLLLVGGVLVIALAVDALAVTYGSAAPAGLPLLALYSVAAGLAGGGSRWLWFLIAAGGYLLLLLAEGRDRLSRWGRVFGGGPPSTGWTGGSGIRAEGSAMAPVRTGRRIGAMALGIALIAPAVLPSLGNGLLDAAAGGSGPGINVGSNSVNPVVALQNNLKQAENREVLTYRTNAPSTSDMYLRIVALDQFDGTQWRAAEHPLSDIPDVFPAPAGLGPDIKATEIITSVAADGDYAQSWLPLPYPAEKLQVGGHWRFDKEGRTVIGDRNQNTRGVKYKVTSLQVQPTAAQLAEAPEPASAFKEEYTRVPDSLPEVVSRTAAQVTRGAANPYEQAVALQRYFHSGNFLYSTQVKSGTGVDAISRFLKDKQGFCIHFAFTMAAMARTLHIPARVAVGFAPGNGPRSDGTVSVGLKDAHAWPELYFEGIGWTRFEPTPFRGTAPNYTVDQPPATGGGPSVPDHGKSAAPSAGASASASCSVKDKALGDCTPLGQDTGSGPTGSGISLARLAGIALPVLLVLGVPLLPLLWRRRERSRRLGGGRGQEEGARTLTAWRELVDTAWDYGILPDESETPRRATARLVRDGGLDEAAAQAAGRVAAAVEQVLYAHRPRPVTGLAADVRQVRDGLHRAAGRRGRLRAVVLPRSAARVIWRLSEQWSATTQRWTAAVRPVTDAIRRPSRHAS
ncbi:DUF3488 and transglutaminase-like domain-containing protein [Streptomyces sp. H10-C2]|uniref:transglutaminase family protein n=1 Tax=Streptomyces sp. H10-C2 TaxID=3046210 RepID=UPI0024B8D5DC|nr:DUF3488 and transglutaminase-like domain-containing protein [Streptomyces sp. H10-C2]MDJ0369556.1 DUF3488 and transglutaminase-like domain-containing protein [Streptomyces sp. H10-C2]